MNDNFTKIVALLVVGSVAKALFSQPRYASTSPVLNAVGANVREMATDAVSTASKRAAGSN